MYIGIEEMFAASLWFIAMTIFWMFWKVHSALNGLDSAPLQIEDLEQLKQLDKAFVRRKDVTTVSQASEDLKELDRSVHEVSDSTSQVVLTLSRLFDAEIQGVKRDTHRLRTDLESLDKPIREANKILDYLEKEIKELNNKDVNA